MHFTKSISAIALASTLILTGCGNDAPKPAEGAAHNHDHSHEAKTETAVPTSGNEAALSINAAMIGIAPPFTFKDEAGKLSGIDVDIINAIGELEGFKVTFSEETWGSVNTALDENKIQLAIGGLNYTEERDGKYGLTKSYFFNPSAFMTKKDGAQPKTLADLSGLKVGVVSGTRQDTELSALPNVQVKRYDTLFSAYKGLFNGEVDVSAYDKLAMQYSIKQDANFAEAVIVTPYEDESNKNTGNIILVKKSDTELLNKLNSGLDKLKADGKLDEIAKKYAFE